MRPRARYPLPFCTLLLVGACGDLPFDGGSDSPPDDLADGELRHGQLMTEHGAMPITVIDDGDEDLRYQGDIRLDRRSVHLDGEPAARAGAIVGKRWPNRIVPYVIDSGLPAAQKTAVQQAIDHWNANTVMRLVPRSGQGDYVRFTGGAGDKCGYSKIGRVGGEQLVRLSGSCIAGGVMHEIGHAVGLWHEQSRSDRDNYVTVFWDNISDGCKTDFSKQDGSKIIDIGRYDYGSIMHYIQSACQLDANKPTILAKPDPSIGLGNFDGLTIHDRGGVQQAYGGTPGDFNKDGIADLLWRNFDTGGNYVWQMAGAPAEAAYPITTVPDTGWVMGATCDFDHDGSNDIAWRHKTTGQVSLWWMNGATYTGGTVIGSVGDPSWSLEGCGDMNGDGHADLVWRHATSGQVSLWLLGASGNVVGYGSLPTQDPAWQLGGIADFDRDGRVDVLWRHRTSGWLTAWEIVGNAQVELTSWLSSSESNPSWVVGQVGDFDGDGRADIAWRNVATRESRIWFMNGYTRRDVAALPTIYADYRMPGQDAP